MNLSTKILIGLGLGIIAGLELGAEGVDFAKTWIGPFGTIFMNMIKMIIVPLVFSSLVIGVCSLGDIKKIGRIGGKTMAYYLGTTAFAIVLGIFLGTVLEPGAGVNMPGEGVKAAAKAAPPIMQVIIDIFPTNAMEAMLKANMLQIIVFSLFMGIGITAVGDRAKTLYNVFDGLAEVSYKIVGFIMNVAPIGVFGLITPVVAANGPAVLLPLLKVVIAVYLGCFLHAVIVYGGLLKFVGKISRSSSSKQFYRHRCFRLPAVPPAAHCLSACNASKSWVFRKTFPVLYCLWALRSIWMALLFIRESAHSSLRRSMGSILRPGSI